MQSLVRLSVLIVLTGALMTSCKKPAPKQAKHIPKNASVVAVINMKALQNKLSKNQQTIENILRSNDSVNVNKGKQEWEDLKQSGLDFDESVYIASVSKGGNALRINSAIADVKDEGKLAAYIKKKTPGTEIKKEKTYSYITKDGDKMIGWDNELVIAMSTDNMVNFRPEGDTNSTDINLQRPINSESDLKMEMDNYFDMKEDQSIASISEFRDLVQDKGDLNFWMNSSASVENLPIQLPKLKELLANSYTAATVKFEDGKVVADTKSYYSKELSDLIKKNTGGTADLDMVSNYPSNNITAFMVMNLNPELFNGLIQYMEMGAVADSYLSKAMGANYTVQDLLKSFKGDFAIVVSDFSMPAMDTAKMQMNRRPMVNVLFNATVGDKAQMKRLLDNLVQRQMLIKQGNNYALAPALQQGGMQINVDDKNLMFSTDERVLHDYKSKTTKAGLAGDVTRGLSGKSGVFYLNIEGLLNGFNSAERARTSTAVQKAKETFKDVKGYADKFSGNHYEGHFELRMKDEKENSLTSLLKMAEGIAKDAKTNGKLSIDTTGVPVTAK